MPIAQRTTPFAAGKVLHRHAANRYVQKLDIGRVHKFGMERFRKFGIWARSELGFGHDVRRAFQTGGIRTWGRNRALKTNRLVTSAYYAVFGGNDRFLYSFIKLKLQVITCVHTSDHGLQASYFYQVF